MVVSRHTGLTDKQSILVYPAQCQSHTHTRTHTNTDTHAHTQLNANHSGLEGIGFSIRPEVNYFIFNLKEHINSLFLSFFVSLCFCPALLPLLWEFLTGGEEGEGDETIELHIRVICQDLCG